MTLADALLIRVTRLRWLAMGAQLHMLAVAAALGGESSQAARTMAELTGDTGPTLEEEFGPQIAAEAREAEERLAAWLKTQQGKRPPPSNPNA